MAERSTGDGDGAAAPGAPAPESAAEALDQAAKARPRDGGPIEGVKTAADIVAENKQRAVSKAAQAERDAAQARRTPGTTTTTTRPAAKKKAAAQPAKGRTASSTANQGLDRVRNRVASVVWLVAVLCAVVLALGALFTALSQTNDSNEIVTWVLARGADLAGPFGDLFKLETAKNTLLVNWGIAALAYLLAGKLVERLIRP